MNAAWARWLSRLGKQPARPRRALSRQAGRPALETLEQRIAPAASNIWIGAVDGNWGTALNWSLGRVPQAGDDLTFAPTVDTKTTNNNVSNLSVNSITFSSSNYSLSGSPVTLDAGITVNPGASGESMALAVNFNNPAAITVNSTADLTISKQVSIAATNTVTKRGVGTLTLGANNSGGLLGPVDVQAGVLAITNANALGDAAVPTTVEANAQLRLQNVTANVNETLLVNGLGLNNDGALLLDAGNTTYAGSIRMDSDSYFGASSGTILTVTGQISDSGFTGGHNLTKVGTGQILFARVGGNTYRGTTTVHDGILTIQDPLSLGAGADATKPQSGTAQSSTTVEFNSTTGEAGTLQIDFNGTLGANDPNGILLDPSKPFNALTNPYVGFQVFNDLLTLNGPGFGGIGALNNLHGKNGWDGDVSFNSPDFGFSDVQIGVTQAAVASASADLNSLTISGVISDTDPNNPPDFDKILPGRLIFNNNNTYSGFTTIRSGAITIRDSHGLGLDPSAGGAGVSVLSGASLEMEVDSFLDGTSLRTHNRNLGFDSKNKTGPGQELLVSGSTGTFRLSLNGQTTGVLDAASATLAADIRAALGGLGTVGGAANLSVTQDGRLFRVLFTGGPLLNANVPLMVVTVVSGTPNVAVNAIYGLTVSKNVTLAGSGLARAGSSDTGALRSISGLNQYNGTLTLGSAATPFVGSIGVDSDTRPGHPLADNNYFTNDYSLTSTGGINDRSSRTTFVKEGTGQLILPTANNGLTGPTHVWEGWITIRNNLALGPAIPDSSKGDGVQPNVITVEAGAALHLKPSGAGVNMTLANRLVLLDGGVGITHPFGLISQKGALESLGGDNTLAGNLVLYGSNGFGVETLAPSGSSKLTLTGLIEDYVPPPRATNLYTNLGPGNAPSPILIDTSAALGTAPGSININYTFFGAVRLQAFYRDQTHGGVQIFDSGFTNGTSTFTIPFGPGTNPFIELVITPQPGATWTLNSVLIVPMKAAGGGGIIKLGSGFMSIQSEGAYSGQDEVREGTLLVQSDSALGHGSTGTFGGNETYVQSTTIVQPGALLELAPSLAANNGGIQAGNQTWDEHLVLNGVGQIISLSGSTGTFTLTFAGQTTDPVLHPLDITSPTLAADVQAALNALSSVSGVGGTATVTRAGNLLTVVFGGSLVGKNNPLITWNNLNVPGNNLALVITGSPFPLFVVSDDNLWRGPVSLGGDTTIAVAKDARLTLYGAIDDATNTDPSGSDLTINQVGTNQYGEVVLAGASSYRGTTTVAQGILTVANGQALGATGGAEVQQITLSGSLSGTFTLSFDGKTTDPALHPLSAASPTLAADIQAALDALDSIGGVGGSVTVSLTGTTYTITFDGGSLVGQNQPTLGWASASGVVVNVTTKQDGFGGTIVTPGAQIQMRGNLTVAGESLVMQGTGVDPANLSGSIPFRWFQVGPAPVDGSQTPAQEASSGRVTAVVVDPSDPDTIYITTAGGGAWKTRNGGFTWTQLFDSSPFNRLYLPANTGTGQFTLSFNGQMTNPISVNGVTAATIQTELNNLSSIGGLTPVAGSVVVSQPVNTLGGLVFNIRFDGSLSGASQPHITAQAVPGTGIDNPVITGEEDGQLANPGNTTTLVPLATYVGAIAIDPTNPHILYIGTGEADNSGDSFYGTGVYKSLDSGRTWNLVTDSDGNNPLYGVAISKIVVDPTTPSRIYVAASDVPVNAPFAASGQAGVYRFDQTTRQVQTLTLPTLSGTGTFTLSYRSPIGQNNDPNSTATPFPSGTTAAINVNSPTLATDIETELNKLDSIGLNGTPATELAYRGKVVVTQSAINPLVFYIAFERSLLGAPPGSPTSAPAPNLITAVGTGITNPVVSASSTWVNLTGTATFTRTSVPTTSTSTDLRATPNPGPNDDYRYRFLSTNVVWSDLSLAGGVLYAAQGNPNGSRFNAVYWTEMPTLAPTSSYATTWFVGDPGVQEVQQITIKEQGGTYTLGFAGNPNASLLQANIDNLPTTTTITVTNGNKFPSTPFAIIVETEVMIVTGGFGTNTWTVQRAARGSTIAAHNAGVAVIPATTLPGGGNGSFQAFPGSTTLPNAPSTTPGLELIDPNTGNWRPGAIVWSIQDALNDLFTIGDRDGVVSVTINAASNRFANPAQLVLDVKFDRDMKYTDVPAIVAVAVGFSSSGGVGISETSAATGPDNRSGGEFPSATFTLGSNGLPPRNGNIKISAVGSTVFAAVTNPNGTLREIQKSTNGGRTWAATTAPPNYQGNQGWYDSTILALNANTVYVGGADSPAMFVTPDGGANWVNITTDATGRGPHADHHGLTVDSLGRILDGDDGGLWRYDPVARTWTDLNGNLATITFNGISSHPTDPDVLLGGSQDNGTEMFTGSQAWQWVDAGDGGQVMFDPLKPQFAYHVLNGSLYKSSNGGQNWAYANINPISGLYFPLVVDQINSARVLVGGEFLYSGDGLFESKDRAGTWQGLNSPLDASVVAIATYQGNLPDGTYQFDPDFPNVANKGASTYDPDTIYVSDGSSVSLTKNHGQDWVDRFPPGFGTIVALVVDPGNRDTVYALYQGSPQSGGNRVYRSTDAGQTWTNITGSGLTRLLDMPVWSMVLDPRPSTGAPNGRLYVGTDNGVWTAAVGTSSWSRVGVGMPQVQVKIMDLNLGLNTLTVGTYGRSAWQFYLDDLQANSGALRVVSGTSSWTGPIRFAAATTITIDGTQNVPNGRATAQLDVAGPISDLTFGANYAFTKQGQGVLVLSAANTYGGVTEVKTGIVLVNNPLALGDFDPAGADAVAQGGTRVTAGAALELESDLEGEPLELHGVGVSPGLNNHNTGALRNVSGQNVYTGTATLASDQETQRVVVSGVDPTTDRFTLSFTVGATTQTTVSLAFNVPASGGALPTDSLQNALNALPLINGAASVVQNGPGDYTITFTGTFGQTNLNQLVLNPQGATTGTVSTLLDGNANVTIGVDSGTTLTIGTDAAGIMTGTGHVASSAVDLTKELTGTLVLGSNNAGFSGATTVNQGALRVANSGALGTGTVATRVLDGAQMQIQSPAARPPTVITKDLILSGTGIFGSGALLNVGGNNTWAGDVTLASLPGFSPFTLPNGTVSFGVSDAADTLTISGNISEAAGIPSGLAKVGPGTLALANANTYTGATYVHQGSLTVENVTALGGRSAALPSVQRITTLSDGGAGPFISPANTFTLTFNGQTTGPLNFGASATAVRNALNGAPLNANVATVTRTAISTVNQAGTTLGGFVYTVTFNTATTLPLTAAGTDPTVASASIVADGGIDVLVDNFASVQIDSSPSATPAGFTVAPHQITLNGNGPTGHGALHNLAGDNTWTGLILLASDSSLGADDSTSLTLTGGISAGSLTVVDPGRVVFPILGVGKSFSQTLTTLSAGNAEVDGTIGDVLLAGGTLSGTGTVGTIAALSGTGNLGTINPGVNDPADTIGTLSTAGGALTANDLLFVDLGDPTSPTSNDMLQVSGTLDLGGAALDGLLLVKDANNDIPAGTSYTIINGATTGRFAGATAPPVVPGALPGSTRTFIDGQKFIVDYFPDHVVVTRWLFDVTMTLVPAVAAPVYGQVETFTVTFAPEDSAPSPTGVVVFHVTAPGGGGTTDYTDAIVVDSMTGVSSATWDPVVETGNPLSLGIYVITASYDGLNASSVPVFNASNSNAVSTTVTAAPTTTVLSPLTSAPYGQNITFTATVASAVSPPLAGNTQPPTGTVTFFDGATPLGSGTLSTDASGVTTATFQTSTLAVSLTPGGHSITARYNSDGTPDNYDTSTSAARVQGITKATTGTKVITSLSPTVFGQAVTFTATITPVTAGTSPPGGTVTFKLGATTLGTVNVSTTGGVTSASYTTTVGQLPVSNTLTITANYSGDTNYNVSSGSVNQTVKQAGTTTVVTSSPGTSTYGQAVTFTATVSANSPGAGTPTGTVTFKLGTTTTLGTVSLDGSGVASYTTTVGQLPAGNNQIITATYNGSSSYTGSAGTVSQTVNRAGTTTVVTASPDTSAYGQAVTFTATVSANSPGAGTPNGSVTFTLGAATLGTVSLSGGVASYTTTVGQLPVGSSQTVTATYGGSSNFLGSSGTTSETVQQAQTTTAIVLSPNTPPSAPVLGQTITFTTTVAPVSPGAGVPTGSLTFLLDSALYTPSQTSLDSSGQVTFTLSTLTVGPHTVSASYPGDTNFATSASGDVSFEVFKAQTTVAIAANPASHSVFGQSVVFTATIAPVAPGTGTPSGTVTFYDGTVSAATQLGTPQTLSGGQASVTLSNLSRATHSIIATYGGDTLFQPSDNVAQPVTYVVNKANTTTTVTVPASSPAIFPGQPFTVSAKVAVTSPGAGTLSGTVTFRFNGGTARIATLDSSTGIATLNGVSDLDAGTYTVTAAYSGDNNFNVSSSQTPQKTVTVTPFATTTSLPTSTLNPSVTGQSVTFTTTVKLADNSPVTSGTVTFFIDDNPQTPVALNGSGQASFSVSNLSGGSHTILAHFDGDTNHVPSDSPTLTQSVASFASTTTVSAPGGLVNNQVFTVTAKVTGSGGTAAGQVIFTIDGADSQPVNLDGTGVARLNVSFPTTAAGKSHSITARYLGSVPPNFTYAASQGNTLKVTVGKAATTAALAPPATTQANVPVVFVATISAVAPGGGVPTGSVVFTVDGAAQAPTGLNGSGQAAITLSLPEGNHAISVTYAGDNNFTGSQTGSTFTFTATTTGGGGGGGGGTPASGVHQIFAVGAGTGNDAAVKVYNEDGSERFSFIAYDSTKIGVRTAVGDVNGDGFADVVVGTLAGPGIANGHVRVFDGKTGQLLASFLSMQGYVGGVFVAAGDVNGDGFADVVVSVDQASANGDAAFNGGLVRIYDGKTLAQSGQAVMISQFQAYPGFNGGVRVAAGDVDGDGQADVITGTGPGVNQAPHVKVFASGDGSQVIRSYLAYGAGFFGGVYVAAANLNGDKFADIVTSADTLGHVKGFDGQTLGEMFSFLAFDRTGGASGGPIGTTDLNGDGISDLLASVRQPGTSVVRVLTPIGGISFTVDTVIGPFPGFAGDVSVS